MSSLFADAEEESAGDHKKTISSHSKKRFYWFLALVATILILTAITIVFTLIFAQDKKDVLLCTTPGCITAGERFSAFMDTSVSPCENFYAYACGGWMAAHPIPEGQQSVSVGSLFKEQSNKAMKKIMEEEEAKVVSSCERAKSVQHELDLYRECVDKEAKEKQGLKPLKTLLTNSLGSKWPALKEEDFEMSSNESSEQKNEHLTLEAKLASLTAVGVEPIIFLRPGQDSTGWRENEYNIIIFKHPETFGLTTKEFENTNGTFDQKLDFYQMKMVQLGRIFLESVEEEKTKNTTLSSLDEKLLESQMKEVFAFERSLLLATQRPENFSTEWKDNNLKMSIEEFTTSTLENSSTSLQLNFTIFLNELAPRVQLSHRFNHSELVLISKSTWYYQKLSQLLQETSPMTVHNYLGFKLVESFVGEIESDKMRKYYTWLNNQTKAEKIVIGKINGQNWEICLENSYNGWGTSRLYVDHFVSQELKTQAEDLASHIMAVFKEKFLKKVTWLEESIHRNYLHKSCSIDFYVAYPKWLLNNTALDFKVNRYPDVDFVPVQKGHYFEIKVEERRREKIKVFQAVNRLLTETSSWKHFFPLYPTNLNARAHRHDLAISLPAINFQPPFFDSTYPLALIYGNTGATIGHEIVHHFDNYGIQITSDGTSYNWNIKEWAETRKRFNEKTKCFVDQYDAIVDRETGLRLNGSLTLSENIADKEGLSIAFLAMKEKLKNNDDKRIPKMEKFTSKQLFFLSYTQRNCKNIWIKERKAIIETIGHLPPEHRVNVPLSNLKQFSDAFQCPLGSKMNPLKKCQLF